jgi:hypothetical protein
MAADTLPVAPLDIHASGSLSTGETAPIGTVSAELRVDSATAPVRAGDLGTANPSAPATDPLVQRADRLSVLFGVALSKRFEISLGLHGTSETLAAGTPGAAPQGESTAAPAPGTGFADASIFLKANMIHASGFDLALAPFAESGAGTAAAAAYTRSVEPKAGIMGILSYGAPGVAEAAIDAGVRYRNPEVAGDVTLRHEQFLNAGVRVYLTRGVSAFVAYDARRLMVAQNDELDSEGHLRYGMADASQVQLGAGVHLGNMDVQAFASKALKQADQRFGFGDETFGMGLGWELGNYQGRRNHPSVATESERDQERKAAEAAYGPKAAKPAAAAATPEPAKVDDTPPAPFPWEPGDQDDAPVDTTNAAIDPLAGVNNGPDEFTEAEKRAAAYLDTKGPESEDARVERELEEIHATEEKAEAERVRIEAEEQAKASEEAIRDAAAKAKREHAEAVEAARKANAIPGITKSELEWDGLGD